MKEKLNEFFDDKNTPISRIILDKGSQFKSKTCKDHLGARKIVCSLTLTYYPQGDGLTKRHSHTLQKKLRLVRYEKKDRLDISVGKATDAMNNTI
jgi:hypothetical protein